MNMEEKWLKITNRELYEAIEEAKNNKMGAPNGIQNETLNMAKDTILPYLAKLFDEIVEGEWVPRQWEVAEIILIHKKGATEDINNYRPIKLTSNMCKIFVKILKNRIS